VLKGHFKKTFLTPFAVNSLHVFSNAATYLKTRQKVDICFHFLRGIKHESNYCGCWYGWAGRGQLAVSSGAALAYELSLADANSAQVAVRRWERRVRPLVQANQAESQQLAKLMMVRHKSASVLINLLMKHMPVTAITKSIINSMEEPF
jgi:hypothetical protein